MDTKPWYQSKIVWMNVVLTLIGASQAVADLLQKQTVSPADAALFVGGLFGIILRVWFTDTQIAK